MPPRAATTRWTLEDLIDFEHASLAPDATTPPESLRRQVREATRGLPHAAARRTGLHLWLDHQRALETRGAWAARPCLPISSQAQTQASSAKSARATEPCFSPATGHRFTSALALTTTLLVAAAFAIGISTVLGLFDRSRGGIHAVWFLVVTLGSQFLVLAVGFAAFLFHRRVGAGFSLVQALAGALTRRLAGNRRPPWWERATQTASSLRPALLWPLARITQEAAVAFNLGLITGLAALVLFRHIGFYWESTTESALAHGLEKTVAVLSTPWRWALPQCLPNIQATRWRPDSPAAFLRHAYGWWTFLLLALACWGLLPRLILRATASCLARRALDHLDFQERHHRALWRDLTDTGRAEPPAGPTDGALILDLGGSGIDPESLRPFLLRRLRVHPVAWHPIAVLDPNREAEARAAIARSPAGVVVLAEGWALSPPRLRALHASVRAAAGPAAPLVFLVANPGPDRSPLPPTAEERVEWERFTDSLADPATETIAYDPVIT